jgi:hypothetical protein
MRRLVISMAAAALVACEEEPLVVERAHVPAARGAAGDGATAAGDQAAPVAPSLGSIESMAGAVSLTRGGDQSEVSVGAAVQVGDEVETGNDGRVRLAIEADGTLLAIGPKSSVVLASFEAGDAGRTGRVEIEAGKFWARIGDWSKGETNIGFDTPSATTVVRGATLSGDVEKDFICALDGEVEVTSKKAKKKKPLNLKKGQCASKLSKPKPKKVKAKPKQVKRFLAEIGISAD